MSWISNLLIFINILSSLLAKPVQLNEKSMTFRNKRASEYNPFNLQHFFHQNPSPLDNKGGNRNGVDALIKRGLNAINDLSRLTFTTSSSLTNDTDKVRETIKNRNSNIDIGSSSSNVADALRGNIETIQSRLNALAIEMGRFIQTITRSTSQLFPSFGGGQPTSTPTKPAKNNNSNSQMNKIFGWLPNLK